MRIAIAGVGLIGGSIARAAHAAGHEVIGVDRAPVLRRARRVLTGTARLADLGRVDLLVLAAPPLANLRMLEELAGTELVITDVTSVKQPVVRAARRIRNFVGGHPMAGREKGGFEASDPRLFRNRPWILTPTARTPRPALRRVEQLVGICGARTVRMTPAAHDRAVAALSHLPQVVAWALDGAPDAAVPRAIAGSGWRDTTRLAGSPRELWREILALNAPEVRRVLRRFERSLARVRREMDV